MPESTAEQRLFVLERDMLEVKEKLREEFATRNHVSDAVSKAMAPFVTTVSELKTTINDLSRLVSNIDTRTEKINASHDKLLSDRAEHERAENEAKIALLQAEKDELKNNTFLKRWGPGLATGAIIATLFKFFLDTVVPLIQSYQMLPHK